ncbi:hypothetical protein EMIT0P228_100203 [Pseudomonas brassicacearum]
MPDKRLNAVSSDLMGFTDPHLIQLQTTYPPNLNHPQETRHDKRATSVAGHADLAGHRARPGGRGVRRDVAR